jgi:hypothetical protein
VGDRGTSRALSLVALAKRENPASHQWSVVSTTALETHVSETSESSETVIRYAYVPTIVFFLRQESFSEYCHGDVALTQYSGARSSLQLFDKQ